jgi:pimeloyl-ACP methyl ester carboxylesterase
MNLDITVPVTDQVKLHVRHWPGVQPRAFLLLHGLTSNARLWDGVACRLATRGYPVYAVDLRGHGESGTPEDGHDTATAAADVAQVGAALGLNGVVVAGHSWGANVALRLAAENPELVGGLALLDGGWADSGRDHDARDHDDRDDGTAASDHGTSDRGTGGRVGSGPGSPVVALRPESATGEITTLAGLRECLRAAHPRWSDGAVDAYLGEMSVGPDGVVAPRLAEAHRRSIVRSLRDEPLVRWYSLVNVPVMLLPILPPAGTWEEDLRDRVKHAEAALPLATTRWYEDSGHHPQVECPERITNDLIDLAGETGYHLFV